MEVYNGTYCVYVHINMINNKKYVGLTKHGDNPNKRWKNGNGYLDKNKNGEYNQPYIANAILKYGWDNFEHEIIASNLTKEEAKHFEEIIISKLNTRDHSNGYNISSGGENYIPSEITILKRTNNIKETIKAKHKNKSFDLFLDRYLNNDPSIFKCEKCGALYEIKGKWNKNRTKKIYNNRGRKYCDDCIYDTNKSLKKKVISCIDCGSEIIVSSKDHQTCRCKQCRDIYNRERKRKNQIKYRNSVNHIK